MAEGGGDFGFYDPDLDHDIDNDDRDDDRDDDWEDDQEVVNRTRPFQPITVGSNTKCK